MLDNNYKIKNDFNISNIIILLLGFFSFFAMPQYHGIKLFHIFALLAFLLLIFENSRVTINNSSRGYFICVLLFYFSTMLGAISVSSVEGFLSSQLFLTYFLVVTLSFTNNKSKILVKGIVYGGIFVACFVICDDICHYLLNFNEPLIMKLLPEFLLESQGHRLINIDYIFGYWVYRPSGFAWDPGMTMPGLLIVLILTQEFDIDMKFKKLVSLVLILAIIISLSKTTIISLLAYIFFKLFFFQGKHLTKKRKIFLGLLLLCIIVFLFNIGDYIEYNGYNGNQRHLKYFSSLYYLFKADSINILFGYGFRNTGIFFNNFVPWLYYYGFSNDAVVESTLTNIFLYGGIVGMVFWFYYAHKIFDSNNLKCILLLFVLVILSFGYSIVSCWFYLVLNLLFYVAIKRT